MDRNPVVKNAALSAAAQKNEYYRDAFRHMMLIVKLEMVAIVALTAVFAVYVNTSRPQDLYFAEASGGKKLRMIGLDYPNMGRVALMNWVAQAAAQIMTFGFNDIDERFSLSRYDFTPEGWESFHSAMVNSGLADSVIKSQQIVTSVPKAPPVLLQEGLVGGVYSWTFEMPLLITFRAGGVQRAETKTVHIVIQQVPTRNSPTGLGISEWYIY